MPKGIHTVDLDSRPLSSSVGATSRSRPYSSSVGGEYLNGIHTVDFPVAILYSSSVGGERLNGVHTVDLNSGERLNGVHTVDLDSRPLTFSVGAGSPRPLCYFL